MKIVGSNIVLVSLALIFAGCSSISDVTTQSVPDALGQVVLPPSYLQGDVKSGGRVLAAASEIDPAEMSANDTPVEMRKGQYLTPLDWAAKEIEGDYGLGESLSVDDKLSVAAEKMPIHEFVHYVFGQLLGLNYVLAPSIENVSGEPLATVTLSVAEPISSKGLFDLTVQLLARRDVHVKFSSDTFFIHRGVEGDVSEEVVISFGREKESVPRTLKKIMQIIPVKFGIKVFMERTLKGLGGATIRPDFAQSTIIAEGSREQILKVIELIDVLDNPAARGKYIALVDLTYISVGNFTEKALVLLENEGIQASLNKGQNTNLVLVPLSQMGAITVFSTDKFFIERVNYWASVLDIPSEGEDKKFYIYNPKYSRAKDLEQSIRSVLGIQGGGPDVGSGTTTGNAPSKSRVSGMSSEGISVAMDEKSNSLIFFSTGQQYRDMQPLLKHLDVVPRQVMLDILIAEVSMKNEFKFGVEWAVSRGEVNLTTQGAFGATAIGGIGLVVDGAEGPLQANVLATNSLVNVLSNPSLMVRAGSSATINVGSSISIVGETTQDPINGDRQKSAVEYKKTGVNISVSVDINSVGIVAMEITQNISNTIPGGSGAGGNPDVFERSLQTDILARSGQTVLLGGLISQSSNVGGSGVPFASKIPIIGRLFGAETRSSDRTELVMLVTPRVIEDLSSWDEIIQDFSKALLYFGPQDQ